MAKRKKTTIACESFSGGNDRLGAWAGVARWSWMQGQIHLLKAHMSSRGNSDFPSNNNTARNTKY